MYNFIMFLQWREFHKHILLCQNTYVKWKIIMLKIEMENIVSKQGKLIYDAPEIYMVPKLQWIYTHHEPRKLYLLMRFQIIESI